TTNAFIADSAVTQAGAVSLSASDTSEIDATIVAAAGGAAAIGAAVAHNLIGWTEDDTRTPAQVRAYVLDSSIDAGGALTLTASEDASVDATVVAASVGLSVGGGAALAASGSGVNVVNRIATDVKAYIDGDGEDGIEATSVTLSATDTSDIDADAESASVAASFAGGTGASISIGVSLAHNEISNVVQASIANADDVHVGTGSVSLTATEDTDIDATAVAASLAVAFGSTGLAVSGAGADATNIILTTTNAF